MINGARSGIARALSIREVVILYLLEGSIDQSTLLVAIVSNRLISVAGDLLFYLFSLLLKNKTNSLEKF